MGAAGPDGGPVARGGGAASIAGRPGRDTWRQPDAGIWEGREGERHYLTSKLACWVALDRAVKLAREIDAEAAVPRWSKARDEVRAAILNEGWNPSSGAFTGAFGSDHLDASVLGMPILGFLPGDDERVLATVRAIERDLTRDGLVQRWTARAMRAPSSPARTGWSRHWPWPGGSTRPGRSSTA